MKTSLAPSPVTVRDPKGTKFLSVVEAAYNKAGLSEEEAQRVNDTPGLADLIGNFIADNRRPDEYKDEEVKSSYGYLSGYRRPNGIAEQVAILRQLFPQLVEGDIASGVPENSDGAEGNFAIPRWQKIAPTYGEAVEIVLGLLSKAYGGRFKNWQEGELGPDRLRQSAKSDAAWDKIGEAQKSDILVVAAQFGIRHRGKFVRRARVVMSTSEFGLGAFAVGIMLLTHPERLKQYDDLWIDCVGDEYAPGAAGKFVRAPIFYFRDGELGFDCFGVVYAGDGCGSASAFLPQ